MSHEYARYEDIDKEQLQIDIEEIKKNLGPVGQEDFVKVFLSYWT